MRLVSLALVLLLASASVAAANGRFPASNQISFHPLDPDVLVARTTFGLLITRDGGENFNWVCEELLQTRMLEDPAIAVMGDGSTIISLFRGQRRGTPDDCTWDFVSPELQNRVIIDNIADPTNPAAAWIITSDGARPNAVWRTTDNGVSWTKITEDFEGYLFETIEVAPTNTLRMYLTGNIPPTSTMARQPFIFRSDDGGESWELFPFELESGAQTDLNIYLAAVDPENEDRIFMRVLGSPSDKLVVSDDGGETFHKVVAFPGMLGFARSADGQHVWVGGDLGDSSEGLYYSEDRGENFDPVTSSVHLDDGSTMPIPMRTSCLATRGDELWACGNNFSDRFTLGYSNDHGQTFTPVVRFADIQGPPEHCAASTSVQSTCAPLYPALMTLLSIDGGVPDVDGGVVELDAGEMDAGGMDSGAVVTPPPAEPTCSCAIAQPSRFNTSAYSFLSACMLIAIARSRGRRRDKR